MTAPPPKHPGVTSGPDAPSNGAGGSMHAAHNRCRLKGSLQRFGEFL